MSMAVELKTDAAFGGYNEDEGKFSTVLSYPSTWLIFYNCGDGQEVVCECCNGRVRTWGLQIPNWVKLACLCAHKKFFAGLESWDMGMGSTCHVLAAWVLQNSSHMPRAL